MDNGRTTNGTKQVPVVAKADPIFPLRQAMNRLFDDFHLGVPIHHLDDFSGLAPRIDIKETDKEVIITAELPGMKPEDVELKVVGDNVVLSGEKKQEHEESKADYYRVERSYGIFQRVLPIPSGVDRDAIQATITHGVLRVSLPKTKAAQQSNKKIDIKKA